MEFKEYQPVHYRPAFRNTGYWNFFYLGKEGFSCILVGKIPASLPVTSVSPRNDFRLTYTAVRDRINIYEGWIGEA